MTPRIEKVWKERLRKVYDNSFEQFEGYSDIYGLAERLGFDSALDAWEENPLIQGSTNPADYKVVQGRTRKAKQAREIQFHSDDMLGANSHPAINVKYRGDAPSEHAWEVAVEQFWMFAQDIAHEHGYSGVFSEGRSSGWLVPFFQSAGGKLQKFTQWPGQGPELGYPTYPDVEKPAERKQFIRFQKAILELLASVPEMLADNAKEQE